MTLTQKLLSGFLSISILTLAISYFTESLVRGKIINNFQEVGGKMLPGDIALARMKTKLYQVLELASRFAEKGDIEDKLKVEKALSLLNTYKTMHTIYHLEHTDQDKEIDESIETFTSYIAEYLLLIQSGGRKEELTEVKLKINRTVDDFVSSVTPQIEADFNKSVIKLEAAKQENLKARWLLFAVSIAILIIAFGLSLFLARLLSRPILELKDAALEVGKGKLDIDLRPASKDEIGQLAGAFKEMIQNLSKAKKEIEAWNRELEKRVMEKTDELLKSQAQLIQSEKLAAMGEMAGGLAHELNSPLAGLLPMLEKHKDESRNDPERYKELSLMLDASSYMAKIVRDFSAFSRESKGEFRELGLNEVIDDTLGFITSRIKQNNIKVTRDYNKRLPNILGEKTELQQVILNMITNALDAVTVGGELTVRTDITKDNNVIMEFIDNGAGIEQEHLGKIFDPFYTTKRPGKGTGLGLSVSYKIIEKHGGNISVESEPGKGTKFTISLPAQKTGDL